MDCCCSTNVASSCKIVEVVAKSLIGEGLEREVQEGGQPSCWVRVSRTLLFLASRRRRQKRTCTIALV